VSTRSCSPVSGSTSQRSPTFGSSCSRGSRISTAITSCRPASWSRGLRQSGVPRQSETTTTSEALVASAPVRRNASPREVAPLARAVLVPPHREQQSDQPGASLAGRLGLRVLVAERDDPEPVADGASRRARPRARLLRRRRPSAGLRSRSASRATCRGRATSPSRARRAVRARAAAPCAPSRSSRSGAGRRRGRTA
jgi:hypothetical protein